MRCWSEASVPFWCHGTYALTTASFTQMKSPLSEFYLAVNRAAWEFMRSHKGGGIDGISNPDAITMAMAINESLIIDRGHFFVDVEYEGRLTSGYSVVDLQGVLNKAPNAEVVLKADKDAFKAMLLELLKG
jgi:purine nucleosidase